MQILSSPPTGCFTKPSQALNPAFEKRFILRIFHATNAAFYLLPVWSADDDDALLAPLAVI